MFVNILLLIVMILILVLLIVVFLPGDVLGNMLNANPQMPVMVHIVTLHKEVAFLKITLNSVQYSLNSWEVYVLTLVVTLILDVGQNLLNVTIIMSALTIGAILTSDVSMNLLHNLVITNVILVLAILKLV